MTGDGEEKRRSISSTLLAVNRLLKAEYQTPNLGNKADPLDELIFICLTQRTNEAGFTRAYEALRRRFPAWERMARARESTIAKAIESGGLTGIKSKRIKRILGAVHEEVGEYSLTHLGDLPDDEVLTFLTKRLGSGTKTAYCVMMYSLGRDVFPIDANCLRILQRMQLLPSGIRNNQAHVLLRGLVPTGIAFDLHVNMVVHGRAVCGRAPKCGECVLAGLCPHPQRAAHTD
ncbi:MAG: endonuclease III [Candidatus Eisenbacteria bacterium]|nr:endonuclease III [Candidatus Eisenbacteria bacterium]